MKNILLNRRLWILVIVVAIVLIGLKIKNDGGLERIIPSLTQSQVNETIFVQVSKQFAVTVPKDWSVTEPVSGKQTFIYPTGTKISGNDAQTLIDQDIIIIETAVNKKESFEALINEIKTTAENDGATVQADTKTYGNVSTSTLTVSGKANYEQTFFNTPSVIIITAKTDHPILNDLLKSVTIDLSSYADDIAQATNLTRETGSNIATGRFTDIYNASSENLKKQKNEADFGELLKGVSAEFNNNVLIWGVYINSTGLGAAINIVEQDKITRRGSFYYIKDNDTYLLDALRISGKITYSETAATN